MSRSHKNRKKTMKLMAEVSACINEQGAEADAKRARLANRINSRFPAYRIKNDGSYEKMDPQPDPWNDYTDNSKTEPPKARIMPYTDPICTHPHDVLCNCKLDAAIENLKEDGIDGPIGYGGPEEPPNEYMNNLNRMLGTLEP